MNPERTSTLADQMRAEESALLLIDLQERLAPAIHGIQLLTTNLAKLIAGARRLEVPLLATEHCPDAIGSICIYILMVVILAVRPAGLFPARG